MKCLFKKRLILTLILLIGLYRLAWSQTTAETHAPLIFEKAYLHTDRNVYAPGDTLWFKAYLVNAQDNKPTNSSGNLYVEFIAPDSAKIINREIIRMDNGLGNGDISLPDSLPSGKYRLRAYTNWMRNFGDNFVFEKEITILHTQTAPDIKIATTAKNKAKDKKTATAIILPATTLPSPTVRFYPEGGSMVEGISSIIAVKAQDGYGKGIPARGAVLSSSGDTVSRFSCDSLGMGLFTLLPVKGQSYHAAVNLPGGMLKQSDSYRIQHDQLIFNLPSALSKGLTLQVRQTDSVIRAIVNMTATPGDTAKANTASMIIRHGGKTLINEQLSLAGVQTAFKISTAALPEGISAVTLYDGSGKPECERLVYIHHPGTRADVGIVTDKKAYQPKEKVSVNISAAPNSSLSMAVVDASMVPEQADDIVAYLQLQSEVKGNIENARRYFDTTNVNRFKQLDLLLMTQGWRDFVWRRLADTAIRISYAAENSVSVSGLVKDEITNKPQPNLYVSLFANAATGNKIFTASTNASGHFYVTDLIVYGKQNIMLTSTNAKGEKKGSLWLDTIKPLPVKSIAGRAIAGDATTNAEAKASIAKRESLINSSKLKNVTQLKEVTIEADKKRYVRIAHETPMMTWDLQQEFNITPKDYEYKTLTWFLLNNDKRAFAQDGASPGVKYLIDGHPVTPDIVVNGVLFSYYERMQYPRINVQYPPIAELYFSMPIEKFKKVEVHQVMKIEENSRLTYVIVLTTTPDALTDNPGRLSADVEGYYQARTFYKPVPGTRPSMADYRTTIHWEPNIKTDAIGKATVSFYNALPPTDIRLIVQGITDKGEPVASTASYEIK